MVQTTKRIRSATTDVWRASLIKNYRPCDNCGEARHRDSKSGLCQTCFWRKHRESSPFTGMTQSEYDQQRYDSRKRRDQFLQKKYGITADDYDAIFERQQGRCGICQKEELVIELGTFARGRLVVDHCHRTGRVRGLLCNMCNKGLGSLGDSEAALERALAYLRSTS